MKGLLAKDFNILLLQKKFLGMILAITVIMLMTMEEPSFLVAYLTVTCGIMTLSTLSYDEFDHGHTFLFTLPITRKEYVWSKYVLSVLVSGCAWLSATIVSVLVSVIKVEGYAVADGIAEAVMTFAVCMLIVFIMIPIQIKYGAEKSRVVILAIAGIVVVVAYVAQALSERMAGVISIDMEALYHAIDSVGLAGLVAIAVGTGIAVMLISAVISGRIMEKKQF